MSCKVIAGPDRPVRFLLMDWFARGIDVDAVLPCLKTAVTRARTEKDLRVRVSAYIEERILGAARGKLVVVATHVPTRVLEHNIILIRDGRVLYTGRIPEYGRDW